MKLSRELLEKYAQGKCSPEEIALVHQWMELEEPEVPLPDDIPIQQIEKSVWNRLTDTRPELTKTSPYKTVLLSTAFKYVAAVLIVLLSAVAIIDSAETQQYELMAENYNSSTEKLIRNRNFDLLLASNSKVHVKKEFYRTAKVNFCGPLKVEAQQDIELEISSSCLNVSHEAKKVSFRKGKSYLVFYFDFKDTEIMVVDTDRIFDLPPRLQASALNTL
ncbi:hypothetical protein PZB74_15155 [Porifericola rhodea]|uniref:hypothetical protein n=1 Tax=Porifericola rhodea TaxID=930972 RepID=UPI00266635FB|nr:hypothetical protein [Porifericola rhodea]WKN30301.1 hypothetical protein PZB74_15155 [Porifericola rhodea]